MPTADEITAYIHQNIPVTQAMAIRILEFAEGAVRAFAPLHENINHRETIFGGSLATLGIVTGWALTWATLKSWDLPARVVIQDSRTQFIKPAAGDVESSTMSIEPAEWELLRTSIDRHGKGRLKVDTDIMCGTRRVAVHSGIYVALPPD